MKSITATSNRAVQTSPRAGRGQVLIQEKSFCTCATRCNALCTRLFGQDKIEKYAEKEFDVYSDLVEPCIRMQTLPFLRESDDRLSRSVNCIVSRR